DGGRRRQDFVDERDDVRADACARRRHGDRGRPSLVRRDVLSLGTPEAGRRADGRAGCRRGLRRRGAGQRQTRRDRFDRGQRRSHTNGPMDRRALTWGGIALLLWLVYLVVRPFFTPLGWAAILAIISYPVYARLTRRGWSNSAAAGWTTAFVTFVIIVPAVALAVAFVREALDLAHSVQTAITDGRLSGVQDWWTNFSKRYPFTAQ